MPVWIILIGVVVLLMVVLMYTRASKAPSVEGFKSDIELAAVFAEAQDDYFHDSAPANKGFMVNGKLDVANLNSSLSQPDLYLPMSPDRDYSTYFTENPENKYLEKDKFCKMARMPVDLPAHTNETVGCGWYFVDNVSSPSSAVAGTPEGPLFLEGLPPNGVWHWNLQAAQQKEEIKMCKRIKQCYMIDINGIKGKCGFCKAKGHAVPIFPDGREKYRDANGNFCGEPIIVDGSQCIEPPKAIVTTSAGTSCGSYGFPSPDNSMRMYNKADCDALGGAFRTDGLCLAENGNSFNEECKNLNLPPQILTSSPLNFGGSGPDGENQGQGQEEGAYQDQGPDSQQLGDFGSYQDTLKVEAKVNICSPNSNGRLTIPCLKSMAKGLGYSESGAMMQILGNRGSTNENENIAIGWLNSNGIQVPKSILGEGNIDTISAGNMYNEIFMAMTNSKIAKVKAAAKLLVNGNPDFDACDPELIGKEQIPVNCLQKEFRKAGCQASGAAYPKDSNAAPLRILPIAQVTSTFQNLYNNMKSSRASVQYGAVNDCLGVKYVTE